VQASSRASSGDVSSPDLRVGRGRPLNSQPRRLRYAKQIPRPPGGNSQIRLVHLLQPPGLARLRDGIMIASNEDARSNSWNGFSAKPMSEGVEPRRAPGRFVHELGRRRNSNGISDSFLDADLERSCTTWNFGSGF